MGTHCLAPAAAASSRRSTATAVRIHGGRARHAVTAKQSPGLPSRPRLMVYPVPPYVVGGEAEHDADPVLPLDRVGGGQQHGHQDEPGGQVDDPHQLQAGTGRGGREAGGWWAKGGWGVQASCWGARIESASRLWDWQPQLALRETGTACEHAHLHTITCTTAGPPSGCSHPVGASMATMRNASRSLASLLPAPNTCAITTSLPSPNHLATWPVPGPHW